MDMARRPANVVFDIGNVLVAWDPMALYRKVFDGDEAKAGWFLANICTHDWNVDQDRGRSFAEAVEVLAAAHPDWKEAIAAYHLRWHETVLGPIAGTVAVLEELHSKGTPLYAITNWNDEKYYETRGRFPFLELFRDTVVSAVEKAIKPEPEIFQILCRRNGLRPADCVFIDDSPRNVEGARAVGMQAIHFTGEEALRRELEAMDLL
jgi:2-haloacid dehalogenase